MNKRKIFHSDLLNEFMTDEKRIRFFDLEKTLNDSLKPRFEEAKKKREAIQEQLLLLEPIVDKIAEISRGGVEHVRDSFRKNLLDTCDAVIKDIAPPTKLPEDVAKRIKISKDARSCGMNITLKKEDQELLEKTRFAETLRERLHSSAPQDSSTIKECRKFETIHQRIRKKLKKCKLKDFEESVAFSPWAGICMGTYGSYKEGEEEESDSLNSD